MTGEVQLCRPFVRLHHPSLFLEAPRLNVLELESPFEKTRWKGVMELAGPLGLLTVHSGTKSTAVYATYQEFRGLPVCYLARLDRRSYILDASSLVVWLEDLSAWKKLKYQ